nr:hypothetical protein [Verrucomicrobium spinosum]
MHHVPGLADVVVPVTMEVDPIPTVALVSPESDVVFNGTSSVALEAVASDNSGVIARWNSTQGKYYWPRTIPFRMLWSGGPICPPVSTCLQLVPTTTSAGMECLSR